MEESFMSDYDTLLADASQLPIDQRIQLINALWSTVPDDTALPLSEEWLGEIQRRSDEYDAGMSQAVPWEQVRSHALRRVGRHH
jgi:putative addiction module component (TIGR02574 family)